MSANTFPRSLAAAPAPHPPGHRLQVEIDAAKLLGLLRNQQLCAEDLRCLDSESKRCLWRLCLLACADRRA